MNINHYINRIIRKIKCSTAKKKEIKKELLMDIELRQEQGEALESIISQMGNIKEVADSFNENISLKEKRKYVMKKVISVVAFVAFIVLLAIVVLYKIVPKSVDIENSEYFDKQVVEDTVKETIMLLDDKKYSILQENAIDQMKEIINEETLGNAKAQITDEWGERQSFGAIYMTEMIQGNEHYAVAEIAVSYEYITAVYRLTYDKDMKLAGIYIR